MSQINISQEILHVFSLWAALRISTGTRKPSLTPKRQKLIAEFLQKYNIPVRDIELVLTYFRTSQDTYAVWMRENGYIELENIFRINKWKEKVKRANGISRNTKNCSSEFYIPFYIVPGDRS